jgi:hypothetical protein
MKSKIISLTTFALLVNLCLGAGSVTMNFNTEFESGVPEGFADIAGVPTNGMIWGILIDGSGNGISGNYDVTSSVTENSNYILSTSGIASDDVLWTSANLTSSTDASTEGDGITKGGNGGIYDIADILLQNGVDAGDKFYVVWFSGSTGGVLSDPSFLVPAEGNTGSYGTPFVGVDPVRSAGKSYSGIDGVSTGPGIQLSLVPEPTSAFLASLGVFGLLRRRRN